MIMSEENHDEPIIAHWPGDWAGRQFVDLDNLGDPGWWIDEQIPDVEELLLGDPAEEETAAEVLADAYIRAAQESYFPLPTEFGMSEEEMRKTVISDFLGFIREWRKRTIAEREAARQGRKDP